ncbi:MAG: hypothetical protein ACLUW6_00695 [Coriobacteriaceae bacterium]
MLGNKPLGNTKGLKPDDKRRRAWTKLRLSEPVGKATYSSCYDDEFDQFLAIAPGCPGGR